MNRPISVIGAASSIGIKPYADGTMRRLDLAPNALREQGLIQRLGARDLGDLRPPRYKDFEHLPGRVRNETAVADYSLALAERVAAALQDRAFVLMLGGDCSIVLGSLLGARRYGAARVGLVYLDAHADFATPRTSQTGSAASMCLALAVGRGETPLARVGGAEPLVRHEDVVIVGRRDDADSLIYGEDVLRELSVLDVTDRAVRKRGARETASTVLEHVTRRGIGGFWVHLDADVIDPSVVPAVDSPEPGGLGIDALGDLLLPLVRHPLALGMELTIYDPQLDHNRTSAALLTALLERVLLSEDQ